MSASPVRGTRSNILWSGSNKTAQQTLPSLHYGPAIEVSFLGLSLG